MCLDVVSRQIIPPDPEEITAYKALRGSYAGELHFPYTVYNHSPVCPIGSWLYAHQGESRRLSAPSAPAASACHGYLPGFHVFEKIEDAVKWGKNHGAYAIVQVRVRQVRVHGLQHLGCVPTVPARVFVADEMIVIGRMDGRVTHLAACPVAEGYPIAACDCVGIASKVLQAANKTLDNQQILV